jgi:DNA-binding MarR family transcriptional regulator
MSSDEVQSAPNDWAVPKDQMTPNDHETDRLKVIEQAIADSEELMQRLADNHAPEFLEIDITMPQAKVLYLVAASGTLHMADLVARLGVSLSTISGLVERLVDQGLAARHDDPADRRQVVVSLTLEGTRFIDRFRELNASQLRDLLAVMDDDEVASVRRALALLCAAAERTTTRSLSPATRPSNRRKDAS